MKKALLVIAFVLAAVTSTNAQVMNQIEDRLALRNLVDTFSVLADYKNTDEQQLLFTEDAEMISMENGKVVSDLKGRKQIGDACAQYLSLFSAVYHLNGQQTLTVNGDEASGISYCFVTLIGKDQTGRLMNNQSGVRYRDEYVKQNGRWLIKKRVSDFMWRTANEVK